MTEGIDDTSQFRDVSQCFVEAVRRSMRVANEDEDGLPDALSQTELAERAAMGRSTLAKYLGGRSDEALPILIWTSSAVWRTQSVFHRQYC